jgi:hypothetical protein
MIGGYRSSDNGTELGRTFPMYRTQVEIDRALGSGWRTGLALSHKSNARTDEVNPGVETVHLTISHSF